MTRLLHASLGVIAMLVAACAGGPAEQRIMEVQAVSDDERSVLLLVASCNGNPTAAVDEGEDRIVVRVRGSSTQDDCADSVCIELDQPLAERTLIDASTDRVVPTALSMDALAGCP